MGGLGQTRLGRVISWTLVIWLVLAITASVSAQAPDNTPPADQPGFIAQIVEALLPWQFNSRALLAIFSKPEFAVAAFIALNLIIFCETGLMIFFLPGDSLLVTAGVACYLAGWNLPLLLVTLSLSAIIGDSVSYAIGRRTGPRIFTREKSWFFKKDHLLKAHAFYEKHGGKTIILARFMPIIRTFAPVVAGVAGMNYRRFLSFNVVGGVGWVVSMVLIGFGLISTINPTFQQFLGRDFDVQDHLEKVVILVVLLSISPGLYVWLKSRMSNKAAPPAGPLRHELVQAK